MKRLATLVAGWLALGLAAAGCGESDGDDGSNAGKGGAGGTSGSSSSGKGGGDSGSSGKGGGDRGGSSGSSSSSAGAGSGSGGEAAQCIPEGGDCEPGSGDCCEGACIESATGELSGCRPLCQTEDDCDSGCCQPFTNGGGGFCVDAAYCSCVAQGDACGPSVQSPCCDGSLCAITDGPYSCHQICETSDECPEECCVPVPDTEFSICSPAEFCL
jgi:hypothetical protein